MKTKLSQRVKSFVLDMWTAASYPGPPGSQNKDNVERNRDNPLHSVSPNTILSLSAVWGCVRLIAETISTLPFNVYEKLPDGSRRFAPEYWLYDLLHNSPNADMTAQTFWECYVASMLLRGNAYAEKQFIGSRVVAIDFLLPDRIAYTCIKGVYQFWYNDPWSGRRQIPEENMWHTLGFTVDGRLGLSVIRYGARVFGSAMQTKAAADNTFNQGLLPTIGFKMAHTVKSEQREEFRKNFQKDVAGALKAGQPVLLEGGMEAFDLGINPVDAQLLESRAWDVEEICRWFKVPPVMVGHNEKSSSWPSSTEAQGMLFATYTLRSWLGRIEQSAKRSLFGADRLRYFGEFAIEGLLRADSAGRALFYASALQNGWMNRETVAGLENLPIPDGGKIYTVQSNLIPLDQLGQSNPAADLQKSMQNFLGLIEEPKGGSEKNVEVH